MSEISEVAGNNILIITSNSVENDALVTQLRSKGVSLTKQPQLSGRVKAGGLSGYPIFVLNAERGSLKPESVGALLPKLLLSIKPKLVVLVGFSYGRKGRVELHDVVITNEVVSLGDFEGTDSGIGFRTFPRLTSLLSGESFQAVFDKAKNDLKTDFKRLNLESKLIQGVSVSGEVFANGFQFTERLFANVTDAVAGDMEGHVVALNCRNLEIPWLVVKSPSDFGDGTAGTRNAQAHSASLSAMAAVHLIQAFLSENKLRSAEPLPEFLESAIPVPYESIQVQGSSKYPAYIRKFVASLALGDRYDKDFHDHLIGVLKEHAENAAKHAPGAEVCLRGDTNAIVLEYGGGVFNPLKEYPKMKSAGGGKRELTSFMSSYVESEKIVSIDWTHEDAKNFLRVVFIEANANLRKNFSCSLTLTTEEMREYYLFGNRNLTEFSSCETLWIHVDDQVISDSDGMLLHNLVGKVPKTVQRIVVKGWPKRLIAEHTRMFSYDGRLEFA
ncbi:hypothetical protein [Duganella sp. Dugasp56]|uniref:5'-methylthioadenosine/S-adenosylhomocysteine nucleosidase family protein n=1 Tax=Duganella sp. Dugasp56 TaxID=3243046 RepID=UPI0039B0DAC2